MVSMVMKYRAEIDGLRALAVLPVILFHAGFELFSGGYVGVDVFFVISGYLITTILIEDIERDRFSILNFYQRRARRILPALFAMVIVCIIVGWFVLTPYFYRDLFQTKVSISVLVLYSVSVTTERSTFGKDDSFSEAIAVLVANTPAAKIIRNFFINCLPF